MENEYLAEAKKFLKETNTTLEISFLKRWEHFLNDWHERNIYKCTLKRWARKYSFNFGDSIVNTYSENRMVQRYIEKTNILPWQDIRKFSLSRFNNNDIVLNPNERQILKDTLAKKPSEYDILACLNVDYCETLEDFCDCFGYDSDSREAEKTYKAVQKEQAGLMQLFNDSEIEKLNEIN